MPIKDFERVVRFYEYQNPHGPSMWLPLVGVTLVTPSSNRIDLSLLFDTGASFTTLRADLYPILGLHSWDQGQPTDIATAGGANTVRVYQYDDFRLEVFGKVIECPIQLAQMPPNPLFVGLLGRHTIFNEFGFGFWESLHELYVTANP